MLEKVSNENGRKQISFILIVFLTLLLKFTQKKKKKFIWNP